MFVLTLIWQIYLYFFKRKQIAKEYEEIVNHQDFRQSNADNINQTASKEKINPYKQIWLIQTQDQIVFKKES